MIPASRDPVETENGKHRKGAIVQGADCPRVARKLATRAVVRIGAKNSNARRVYSTVISDNISDDVVGNCCRDCVMRIVKAFREMSGTEQPLLLTGVKRKDDCCVQ